MNVVKSEKCISVCTGRRLLIIRGSFFFEVITFTSYNANLIAEDVNNEIGESDTSTSCG